MILCFGLGIYRKLEKSNALGLWPETYCLELKINLFTIANEFTFTKKEFIIT